MYFQSTSPRIIFTHQTNQSLMRKSLLFSLCCVACITVQAQMYTANVPAIKDDNIRGYFLESPLYWMRLETQTFDKPLEFNGFKQTWNDNTQSWGDTLMRLQELLVRQNNHILCEQQVFQKNTANTWEGLQKVQIFHAPSWVGSTSNKPDSVYYSEWNTEAWQLQRKVLYQLSPIGDTETRKVFAAGQISPDTAEYYTVEPDWEDFLRARYAKDVNGQMTLLDSTIFVTFEDRCTVYWVWQKNEFDSLVNMRRYLYDYFGGNDRSSMDELFPYPQFPEFPWIIRREHKYGISNNPNRLFYNLDTLNYVPGNPAPIAPLKRFIKSFDENWDIQSADIDFGSGIVASPEIRTRFLYTWENGAIKEIMESWRQSNQTYKPVARWVFSTGKLSDDKSPIAADPPVFYAGHGSDLLRIWYTNPNNIALPLRVYNQTGILKYQGESTWPENEISTLGWSAGIYYIQIDLPGAPIVRKVAIFK